MSQSQQRIYPCEYCSFSAKQKRNLEAHVATHTGERPHACPHDECDSAFADPSALVRHRKAKHGYETRGRSRGSPQLQSDIFVQSPPYGGTPAQTSYYAAQDIQHQPPCPSYSNTASSHSGDNSYSPYSQAGHNTSQSAPYATNGAYYQPAVQNGNAMGSTHSQSGTGRPQEHSGYSFPPSQANAPQYNAYNQLVNYDAYAPVPSDWTNNAVYPVQPNGYNPQQQWTQSYGSTNRNGFA